MLRLLAGGLAALPLLTGFASAGELPDNVSANIGVTSNYVFRGITQSDDDPALQGGLDWAGGDFYAGIWASTVDFNDGGTHWETDFYAGWAPSAGGYDFDFGVIHYAYPGSPDTAGEQDFTELYGGIGRSYGAVSWDAKASYSDDFYMETGAAWYLEAGLGYAFTDAFSMDARIGSSSFDDAPGADYEDYQLGATYSLHGFDLDLRLHDVSEGDSELVFSIGRSFGG